MTTRRTEMDDWNQEDEVLAQEPQPIECPNCEGTGVDLTKGDGNIVDCELCQGQGSLGL